MRVLVMVTLFMTGSVLPVAATTLAQLPLDEMARQSTSIVRAKVLSQKAILRKGEVYTVYRLETLESLKRSGATEVVGEVAIPGGVAGGMRQVVSGAPELREGSEYVLFLWTSRSGLTQLMGLSQGLFAVESGGAKGDPMVRREAATERMLDAAGRAVHDTALVMPWSQFKTQVQQALRGRAEGPGPAGRK